MKQRTSNWDSAVASDSSENGINFTTQGYVYENLILRTQGQWIMVVIYVENLQKSCVECFLEVLSVKNVFPVLLLVGNVVRVVNNKQPL